MTKILVFAFNANSCEALVLLANDYRLSCYFGDEGIMTVEELALKDEPVYVFPNVGFYVWEGQMDYDQGWFHGEFRPAYLDDLSKMGVLPAPAQQGSTDV